MTEAKQAGVPAEAAPSPGGPEADEASSQPSDPDLPGPALDKANHENFPVATWVLPRRYRRHLMSVYAFARLVDDVGDSREWPGEDRHRALDQIEADLDRVYHGSPRLPVMRELARTARQCDIPAEPFRRLLGANRQDQTVSRYGTFQELEQYCVLSANPVGRMVLHIFGVATPERVRLSDKVCTALQLIEHWQDVAEDLDRGRVYIPGEDLARFGCTEDDLAAPAASYRFRELMAFETKRAAAILDDGAPLVATLAGYGRLAVAGYVAGGRATLAAITASGYDVLSATPRASGRRVLAQWLPLLAKR